jgi:fumarylacetoacetate (FAA) hydrolase family protein
MNAINIAKGADFTANITLKDQDGILINATLFDKLIVYVTHVNGTVIAKFSKNPSVGYLDIDMTAAATGLIKVKMLSTHTNASPEGKLVYEVHGKINDVTITDDSVLDLLSTNNYLCNIIKSNTGTISMP